MLYLCWTIGKDKYVSEIEITPQETPTPTNTEDNANQPQPTQEEVTPPTASSHTSNTQSKSHKHQLTLAQTQWESKLMEHTLTEGFCLYRPTVWTLLVLPEVPQFTVSSGNLKTGFNFLKSFFFFFKLQPKCHKDVWGSMAPRSFPSFPYKVSK